MAYLLKEITIRTNNTVDGLNKIVELWRDVMSGHLAILVDNENHFQKDISLVERYSNYESDENGDYDFSILGVTEEFFHNLELEVTKGKYIKCDFCEDTLESCTKNAWKTIWSKTKNNTIKRAYTSDYERIIPAEYSKDGRIHCYLYIAILS